jgi:hypothetical protein
MNKVFFPIFLLKSLVSHEPGNTEIFTKVTSLVDDDLQFSDGVVVKKRPLKLLHNLQSHTSVCIKFIYTYVTDTAKI